MKENLVVSASPHITKPDHSVLRIMIDVLIALCPCVIAAVFWFGYGVVINIVVAVGACIGFELLYDAGVRGKFKKGCMKDASIKDGSAAVTGVILALNFPTFLKVEAWDFNIYRSGIKVPTVADIVFSFDTVIMLIIASAFAIVLVKMLCGGIGKNFVNPAAAGRVFAFMTVSLAAVQTVGLGLDATTGATWLSGQTNGADGTVLYNMFIGHTGSAAVGETCVIAAIVGYVYLVVRKVIDFRLPLVIVGSAFVFALLFDGIGGVVDGTLETAADVFMNAAAHVLSGGLIFGAVYMATDYATSPNTVWGRVIFGVGIALITMLIRVYASAPEGMSFAILIMNIVTPLIDRYVYPRPFGYKKPEKTKKPEKAGSKEGSAA